MKTIMAAVACAFAMSVVGCAAERTNETTKATDSELSSSSLGAENAIRCSSDGTTLALVRTASGKVAMLSLTPAGDLYALSRGLGTVTSTSSSGLSWKNASTTLTIKQNMKGKLYRGSESEDVTCERLAAGSPEAASWRTANALQDDVGEIDGIASAVLEESSEPMPNDYTVYVVETSRRSSLSLGNVVANTAGSISKTSDPDDSICSGRRPAPSRFGDTLQPRSQYRQGYDRVQRRPTMLLMA